MYVKVCNMVFFEKKNCRHSGYIQLFVKVLTHDVEKKNMFVYLYVHTFE